MGSGRFTDELRADLEAVVGPPGLLTGSAIAERYCADWSGRDPCRPCVVVRPATTEQVARVLALCQAARHPVVVQGGLTGLSGGATPLSGEIALSLERLTGVEHVDSTALTLRARAGTTLTAVQEAAAAHGAFFPLDLGSRGSCTVGGVIATNAGGNRVIRYGMTRQLVLGLEVVLADGTILRALNTVLKDNAGYDLKHLFVGAEGTLGVITRAELRLQGAPQELVTVMLGAPAFAALVQVLTTLRLEMPRALCAFEVMWPAYYEAASMLAAGPPPVGYGHGCYALIELESASAHDRQRIETLLTEAIERGWLEDAAVAQSARESAAMWAIREASAAVAEGVAPSVSYDVSVPLARMDEYVSTVQMHVAKLRLSARLFAFGHLGDGNVHFIAAPRTEGAAAELDRTVYGLLGNNGSVSAEHGIGVHKRDWLRFSRTPEEIATMRALKRALDPNDILNRGRILPET